MKLWAILKRELWAYFVSPLAWVVLALFLAVQGYSFWLLLGILSHPAAPHGEPLQLFFGGTFLYWLTMMVVTTVLTMRLFAEERNVGSLERLLAAPVTVITVVLGKYLAALVFYAFLWLPTLFYVLVLILLGESRDVSLGPIAASYGGTLLVGASFLAVGTLASSLARSQLVAAMLSFALLALLLLVGGMAPLIRNVTFTAVIDYVNVFDQLQGFAKGLIDTRPVVFHLSLACACLFTARLSVEQRPWR